MASTIGKVGPFDDKQEEWDHYIERLGFFFSANKITDAGQKRAVLLTVCGPQTYKLIRNLVAPEQTGAVDYTVIVEKVKEHVNPKPSAIVQRFRFNSRVQRPGESIADFVAELRRLSPDCEFGATLSEMLRDRLVCGVREERVQRRLLQEVKLTFDDALRIARSMETASKNAEKISRVPTTLRDEEQEVHQTQSKTNTQGKPKCYRCLGAHEAGKCRFMKAECHKYKKQGHLARACRSLTSKPSPQKAAHQVMGDEEELDDNSVTEDTADLFTVHLVGKTSPTAPLVATMTINRKPVRLEVDTGTSVSLVSENTFRRLWKRKEAPGLKQPRIRLRTYSGKQLTVLGEAYVQVRYEQQVATVPLIVVQGEGNLLGRNWMQKFKLNWRHILGEGQINSMEVESTASTELNLRAKFKEVFEEEMGLLQGTEASLSVEPTSKPRFFKPRPVPYAYREKVEQELRRLEHDGIIQPVRFSEWAAPIVPVLKANGSMRICGDYRLTVNQAAQKESYPLPRIEDLLSNLAGGDTFTKLDLSNAYQQVALNEESRKYVVINTHLELFQYNRLPFGVASAPAIFQRIMDSLLQGIPNVVVYLDDILVTGKTLKEHRQNLETVLTRLSQAGLRLKSSKCTFFKPEVQYLGHRN